MNGMEEKVASIQMDISIDNKTIYTKINSSSYPVTNYSNLKGFLSIRKNYKCLRIFVR